MDTKVQSNLSEVIERLKATISTAVFCGDLDLVEALIPQLRALETLNKVKDKPEKDATQERDREAFQLLVGLMTHAREYMQSGFEEDRMFTSSSFDDDFMPKAKALTGVQ